MDLNTYLTDRTNKALAELVEVSQVMISQWKTGARRVPAEMCPRIERATNGAVRCEDLRPDVDWAFLRATDCPTAAIESKQAA